LSESTPVGPGPFLGRRRGAEFTRRLDVATELEYLEEALEEVEAAARWYAERSVSAATGFTEEIDEAESRLWSSPTLGLPSTTGHVGTCFGAIHSASSTASSLDES
jgi:plasmid stabilization system protein ParE